MLVLWYYSPNHALHCTNTRTAHTTRTRTRTQVSDSPATVGAIMLEEMKKIGKA